MLRPAPATPVASVAQIDERSPQVLAPAAEAPAVGPDPESRAWVADLSGSGARRLDAEARLHELLLKAARFEVGRRRAALPHLRGDDYDDLAHQAAGDAMMAILDKLDTYRGDSRFTTWVYKFALLEAAVKLRRRSWQGREVVLESEQWSLLSASEITPEHESVDRSVLEALGEAMRTELSPHQREVLIAVAINGVPIDVLSERLGSTRGALYKTIHDARKRLRATLASAGLRFEEPPLTESSR